LIIFVFAYWKILVVVRRRKAKAAPSLPSQRNTARISKQMAETSMVTLEQANAGSSIEAESHRDQKMALALANESKGHREVGGQKKSKKSELSKTQVNVVKTMVYITICFTLCWMPMYLYHLLSTFQVNFVQCF